MPETIIIPNEKKAFPVLVRQYEGLMWLIRACAPKGDKRLYLEQTFLVQDAICFATDGHRMHVFCQEDDDLREDMLLRDGQYKIESATKKSLILTRKPDDSLAYPNPWVILKYRPYNGIPDLRPDSYSRFLYHVCTNVGLFDKKYLSDAFIPDMTLHFEKMGASPLSGVVFGDENQFAVVMPLKL